MKYVFFFVVVLITTFFACESADSKISNQIEASKSKHAGGTTTQPDGMAIFRRNCTTCHGSDGKLGINGAKDLTASELTLESRVQIITNGKNLMTPFKALLQPEDIEAVARYTLSLNPQLPTLSAK